VGRHVAVRVADPPLELLKVGFLLNLAHHCHVRLGHHQVGSTLEPELLVKRHRLHTVSDLGEEHGIGINIDGPGILIQINQILVLRIQLTK